jgi:hypothetical protein
MKITSLLSRNRVAKAVMSAHCASPATKGTHETLEEKLRQINVKATHQTKAPCSNYFFPRIALVLAASGKLFAVATVPASQVSNRA